MVADAFIENPDKYPNVIHLNNDLNDNPAINLGWVSNSACRLRGTKSKYNSSHYKEVQQLKNGKTIHSTLLDVMIRVLNSIMVILLGLISQIAKQMNEFYYK